MLISFSRDKRRGEKRKFQKDSKGYDQEDQEAKTSLGCEKMRNESKKRSYKEDDFVKSGISGSLKFHGFASGGENENNCEDEQELAGVITCA